VTLTVTDNQGATAFHSDTVVAEQPVAVIDLSASSYSIFSRFYIDLTWHGANGQNVDVYVGGNYYWTTANDGALRVSTRYRGTYRFQVCEQGSSNDCSNEVDVRL
jgi:hypothetical protein